MFFTSILKSGEKVIGIVGGIAFPILGMLGGAFFPIDSYMPQWFNILSYVSPLKWFNNGMMQMIYKGNNIPLIIESIVALLIGIALVFMNFSFDSFSSGVKVGIDDSDQSKSSQFLIKILEENKQYKVTLYDSYEKALI